MPTAVTVIAPFYYPAGTPLAVGATAPLPDSLASEMVSAGKARYVTAPVITPRDLSAAEVAATQALVSDAGNVDAYSADVWQEITATGLAIPLPVTVKAIKLISGTTPTLALRDALVDTYTAASASADVAFDSSVTPVQLGYEHPLNKLFRLGVHATVGGTSPRWAIKV